MPRKIPMLGQNAQKYFNLGRMFVELLAYDVSKAFGL
jgi:hypothetical protein